VKVKVVKNKVAPPFRLAEFDIMFGKGISHSGEVLDLAVEDNIVQKAGSWFSYNGDKLGQGRDSVRSLLEENPDLMTEIEEKILVSRGIKEEAAQNGKAEKEKKEKKD
jgi:recombination protein RecA